MQLLLEGEQCRFILHFADAVAFTDSAGVRLKESLLW
jgi:hypothetical protein